MTVLPVQPEPVPMISFTGARRAEEATRVRLDVFDGPLALLLALIEQRQLDVLTVPLGELAPAFLDALAGLEERRLSMLSAFVGVSAQLILIKSRALLPRSPSADQAGQASSEEGNDPEAELRQRLLLYRTFRDAAVRLSMLADGDRGLFHREAATAQAAGLAGASAPTLPALDPAALADALRRSARLAPALAPRPAVIARTITLEERAQLIRQALQRAPTIVLQELLHDVRDRVVVAVTFMALLEMVKGREIAITQRQPWGPISVSALADGR
jgi:segregation and condensation protein A